MDAAAAAAETRQRYRFFIEIPTRWSDNDMMGHVNNVSFNRFFETIVVTFLTAEIKLDWRKGPVVTFLAESLCRFHRPLSFPETIEGALRAAHIGNTSVRWELALFTAGEEAPAATGYWAHVFVDRKTGRPTPIPADIRAICERVRVG